VSKASPHLTLVESSGTIAVSSVVSLGDHDGVTGSSGGMWSGSLHPGVSLRRVSALPVMGVSAVLALTLYAPESWRRVDRGLCCSSGSWGWGHRQHWSPTPRSSSAQPGRHPVDATSVKVVLVKSLVSAPVCNWLLGTGTVRYDHFKRGR